MLAPTRRSRPRLRSRAPPTSKEVKQDKEKVLRQLPTLSVGDSIRVSVWDCGGQPVYYLVHSLFLNPNSVYLVVFDMTKWGSGQCEEYLLHWLQSLHMHAPDAPFAIVGTHLDAFKSQYKKREYLIRTVDDVDKAKEGIAMHE